MSTTITFAEANSGFQAGIIHGPVHHNAPSERLETPPPPSIVIPFSRDKDFVDRRALVDDEKSLIDQIDQTCSRPGSRNALVGLGGVGKSQLAIEYAYRVRERLPQTWVFWVHASNAARFEQSFRDIASCVKIFGRQNPKANIFKLAHDWLHNRTKGPWVMILDNVDDAGFLVTSNAGAGAQACTAEDNDSRPLLASLPHCQHGSVLVTSRSRDSALELVEAADIIAVDPMTPQDAVTLFQKKCNRPIAGDGAELVTVLVTALEYLPLAIVQAGAYISHRWPRCSIQSYLDEFLASHRRKTGLLGYEAGKLRRDASAKNSILITWQISFDYIRQTRPSAADMLSLMSFCDRQGIPDILLRDRNQTSQSALQEAPPHGTEMGAEGDEGNADTFNYEEDENDFTGLRSDNDDDDGFEDDILILRDYSFVVTSEDGYNFEMHRLVQLATLKWLEFHGVQDKWRHRFLRKLCTQAPTGTYENWTRWRALFPHAQSAATQAPKARDSLLEWATVLYRAAWYMSEIGNGAEAERLSVTAMKARKKLFEAEHEEVLWAMAMVASVYRLRGRWDAAEKLEIQVMEARKTKLGADHPDTLTSMANLASTFSNQGRWEEAEKLFMQLMETFQTKLGADHPHTLSSMANLASTFWNQGRWEEAEKLEVQVMETCKTKLGADHPSTLPPRSPVWETLRTLTGAKIVLEKP